jgi:hypothetical protein
VPEVEVPPDIVPDSPITRLVWLASRSVYVGAAGHTLFNIRVDLEAEPSLRWPQQEFDWQELANAQEIHSLLVLGNEQLQDVFVGTDRGVVVVRGGPGLGSEVKLEDCAGVADNGGRVPPSETAVYALAQYGARLYIGTEAGLAVTSTPGEVLAATAAPPDQTKDKAKEPSASKSKEPSGANADDSVCVRWLPTEVSSSIDMPIAQLPVFPPGLDVTALLPGDDRLVVLTQDRGLFFLEGAAP